MHSPAGIIDVRTGWPGVRHHDISAELRQQPWSDLTHRAIRAINDDAKASQPVGPWKMLEQNFLVTFRASGVIPGCYHSARHLISALIAGLSAQHFENAFLDFSLIGVGEFRSIRSEYFDAIVGVDIVRGRNHDAARISEPFCEKQWPASESHRHSEAWQACERTLFADARRSTDSTPACLVLPKPCRRAFRRSRGLS